MTQTTKKNDTLYISSDWFDSAANSATITSGSYSDNSNLYTTSYWYPHYTRTEIRMSLSEIEHIRELCKTDKKLKASMKKIAPYIRIEVDF